MSLYMQWYFSGYYEPVYNMQVFDCLKSAILKSFKDRDRCTASRWIQSESTP